MSNANIEDGRSASAAPLPSFVEDTAKVRALAVEVHRLATDNPEYVHKTHCVYVQDGKGCCIVGQAAMNTGLIDASLENYGSNEGTGVQGLLSGYLGLNIRYGSADIQYLSQMQEHQDNGVKWKDADEWAREETGWEV